MTATATPSPVATLTPTVASAQLVLSKTDFLFSDADRNNLVSAGDKLLYAVTIINTGQRPAQQLHFVDTLDANTLLVVGTLNTDRGQIGQGNTPGDTRVVLELDRLDPGARVSLSFQVSIKLQVNDTQVQNQAVATFVDADGGPIGQTVVISDDPDTSDALDATVTPLNGNPPHPQPKLFLPFVARKE